MSDLDDFLESLDVEELFDELGVDWRRTSGGTDLQVRSCPTCKDDRWRVYFSTVKRTGVCFHADCQKRFNVFSFTRDQLGAETKDTFRFFEGYSARLGRVIRRPQLRIVPRPLDGAWELPKSVALPTPEGATHPYLLKRGITLRTQEDFGMLWCEEGFYGFTNAEGQQKWMPFHGRVILPIKDLDGTLKTFVGRDATGTAQLRYLFPPMLPAAGTFLYGGDRAMGREHVIAGEGPFDCIAIHQAIVDHPDFRNAAAIGTFGISVGHASSEGDDQLGRLRRLWNAGMKRLTFLWDGEKNALRSALKHAGVVARAIAGLDVRIGLLPPDTDPGEVQSNVIRREVDRAVPWSPLAEAQLLLRSPYK